MVTRPQPRPKIANSRCYRAITRGDPLMEMAAAESAPLATGPPILDADQTVMK